MPQQPPSISSSQPVYTNFESNENGRREINVKQLLWQTHNNSENHI